MKGERLRDIWENQLVGRNTIGHHEKIFIGKLSELATNSKKVLEVGVGKGRMINILKCNNQNTIYYGIDLWQDNRENISSRLIFLVADARHLPFKDNCFDLVYSLGVVEHFEETSLSIREHARVVKTGGHVLITVPRLSIYTIIRLMSYLLKERKRGTFQEVIGKNLTIRAIKKTFVNSGLEVIEKGASGVAVPKIHRFWIRYISQILPDRIFGAYLFCLGKKQS